jgi:type IV secretory pathway TraG/TraD family ATPase VirD4
MDYVPERRVTQPPLSQTPAFVITVCLCALFAAYWLMMTKVYFFRSSQAMEIAVYISSAIAMPGTAIYLYATRRSRRERRKIHPPLVMSPVRDRQVAQNAWEQNAVVLGYDIHGEPWLWPDQVRVMQGIVLGMTGSGKTTLLKNIITQDLMRRTGPPEDRHKIPMVIFDGKGDLEFFQELVPYIHRAGRLGDLRLINPARPDLSSLYNPLYSEDDDYMAQVNMVFGSFNLHDEFFAKHQLNYLADIVRILHYTGLRFNFYDVIVAVLDREVLQEQIEKAREHIRTANDISHQRRLNFEMSVRNLMQSFEDRERVPKIQGLLNECMTFLDDALSIITGPYDDLLSIDEVIEKELILFVTLNVNKNTEPVRALGKMLLQNIQLVVGRRYESEEERKRANRPLLSIVMDEFAPFGYQNFSQILNTARGTNTAFLFSMQSVPQLLKIGKGFKEDVTSAPNTKIVMRTQDEETARYFIHASAEQEVTRRTQSLVRHQLFGWERFEKGLSASEREEREYRAQDERIKNLPLGQMQILMTDNTQGTLHQHLHVRTPPDIKLPGFEWELLPRLRHSLADQQQGANLRFKNPEAAGSSPWGKKIGMRK